MNEFWQNTRNELKDPKKLGVLVVLVAVGLLLWGRLLLKQVPQTATAEPVPVQTGNGMAELVENPTKSASAEPFLELSLSQTLTRDLFAIDRGEYRRSEKFHNPEAQRPKSGFDLSDEFLRSASVRNAAEKLTLQSVMMGEQPRAMINGQLLALNQGVEGFTLIEVGERHVLLENKGIIIRLKM